MAAIPWEAVGVALAILAPLTKSCYNGYLRTHVIVPVLQKHRTATDAHAAIPEIRETVEQIDENVGDLKDGQRDLRETMAYLHADDLQEEALLRDRLDFEHDDDLLRGGE